MTTSHIKVPQGGQKIIPGQAIPDNPIIPFIEGDGIGIDITPVMQKVVDAAVAKAYGGKRKIHWMEIYAGEKSTRVYGGDVWLPDETLKALKEYVISIKGPMTTPVGGGTVKPRAAMPCQPGSISASPHSSPKAPGWRVTPVMPRSPAAGATGQGGAHNPR